MKFRVPQIAKKHTARNFIGKDTRMYTDLPIVEITCFMNRIYDLFPRKRQFNRNK